MLQKSTDSAPAGQLDVSSISDAVVKKEPKSQYGNPKSYTVRGQRYYVLDSSQGFVEQGFASWYGTKFHGRKTSNGETYDMYAMTAAHKRLPLPTYVKVTNLDNRRHVIVRVNDRGPFHGNRIIDLSYAAAAKLDILKKGTALVEVRAIAAGAPDVSRQLADTKTPVFNKSNNGRFYIQVGAFKQLVNAEMLKKKLMPIGHRLIKISRSVLPEGLYHRVRIGPLDSIDVADTIISRLPKLGVFEHHIVVE